MTNMTFAVWICALGAYNNGDHHGQWIDLEEADTKEKLQAKIDKILKSSPQPGEEEWAMHDSIGLPTFISSTEWPDWDKVLEYVENASDFKCTQALECYQVCCENNLRVMSIDDYEECFVGVYESEEDFAQEDQESRADLGVLASYIDWEMVWHGEYECSSYWSTRIRDGVAIFSK